MSKELTAALEAAGASWQGAGDDAVAADFGDFVGEYAALTTGGGLVVMADRTQIELSGRDRATFLHNFCTNEIRKLTPGAGCEAFICNTQGKLVGHVLVFCQPDALLLDTVPGQAETLIKHLDRYLIREQVELHDRSEAWTELLLAGPAAEGLLAGLGVSLPAADRLSHIVTQLAGRPIQVRRVGFVRPTALLLSCERADAAAVWTALRSAGATPCGWRAFEAARIEAGWPQFGQDMTPDNLPQELARDALAISFVKGCYLGQETVARIDALGHVNRTLGAVRFRSSTAPQAGTELTAGEKPAGQVTSAAFSPRISASIGLAMLRRGQNQPGTQLKSAAGEAEVVALPMP